MASLFDLIPDEKIKGFAGKEYAVPMYLQFVPGYCSEVCHSSESPFHTSLNHTNSIIAVPHHSKKFYKRRSTSYGENDRYYPLFRTIHDVPTKGDPVLLCNIGGINYYLGPLNMKSNSPTWNDNEFYVPELSVFTTKNGATTARGEKGESVNFNKNTLYKRIHKQRKIGLDYGRAIGEATGDTLIEGRHGNSIRVGSRSNNPYVFISNERHHLQRQESMIDGSLISITSNGSLAQHFGSTISAEDENTFLLKSGFLLASDTIKDNQPLKRYMAELVSYVNNNDNSDEIIYKYGSVDFATNNGVIPKGVRGNQMLLHSDRITLNSKLDDIYLSSIKDIHIGTGRHLTISTNENLIIDSESISFGNPNKTKMQSMVLGDKLQKVLEDLLKLIQSAEAISLLGKIPLVFQPKQLESVQKQIEQILSNKHFIEENPPPPTQGPQNEGG